MAESIVEKIKAKLSQIKLDLPFLKKKKSEEDADPNYNKPNKKQNDVDINSSSSDATQPDKTNPNVKIDELTEEVAEEKPKKESLLSKKIKVGSREIKLLHIIVVLGALYFAMDFLTTEEQPVDETPVETPKPKKKRKKKEADEANTAVDGQATVAPSEAPNPEATPSADTTPEVTAEVTPEAVETPIVTEDVPATESKPAPSETPVVTSAEPEINLEEINKEAESKDKEILAATPTPEASPVVEEAPVASGESKETEKKEEDIASDLLKNLSDAEDKEKTEDVQGANVKETSPPNYEVLGRGLVYNCVDKHWACLSRAEYSTCKNNRIWNEKKSNKKQCQEISVYATEKDCQNAQKSKIDNLATTEFCN